MNQKQIIFVHESLTAWKASIGSYRWVFFGQDYINYLKWQKKLGEAAEIKISEQLEETANQLRRPFIDLIVDLGKTHDSTAWWSSRVSERNTLVSPLFLYCCYQKIFEEIIVETGGPLIVIGEDWSLLEALAEVAPKKGQMIRWVSRLPSYLRNWRYGYRALGRMVKVLGRGLLLKTAGPGTLPLKNKNDNYLIHTYIDEGCFSRDGSFNDRYFPKLGEWLVKEGNHVLILPVLVNIKGSPQALAKRFQKSGKNFINPHFYYGFSDYLFAIIEGLKQGGMFKDPVFLQGMDVSLLFREESKRYSLGTLESLLYARLPKRLVNTGFELKQVITPFENMVDEKMFILGLRKYSPRTRITAFQHSALSPLVLCLFVTAKEAEFSPLPDKIICHGDLSRRILMHEGLPEKLVSVGPALRHAGMPIDQTSQELWDVLVVIPLMSSDAAELLNKTITALGNIKDIKVAIKWHPMMRPEVILSIKNSLTIPEHFEFVQGHLAQQVKSSKLVLIMGSTAALEILTGGTPVIVVGRQTAINFNPMGFLPNMSKVLYLPQEIHRETLRLLDSSAERQEFGKKGRELFKDMFNPLTDSLMQEFLCHPSIS